ncbi:transposase [Arthrobacter sp. Soil762]|nr:IS5 family transposase [Arthrobacter sp. Soil762]KRE76019.1 transposase [Arthrobacter sp. Soil762]
MSSRYALLSDVQWKFIAPLMPDSSGKPGRPFNDHRLMTEGIIYRYRAGIPWRDLPSHFGSWKTVWKHHRRNSASGTWDKVLAALLTRADAQGLINWEVSVDSTVNRAHQHGTNLPRHTGGPLELHESAR